MQLNEIWAPVPVDNLKDLYELSSLGNFRSRHFRIGGGNSKILKPKVMHDGYLYIRMNPLNDRQHFYNAHRLVATAFIPNPLAKPQVNHINSVRSDNRQENLEWVTAKENMQHALKFGNFKNSIACLAKYRESRGGSTQAFSICHPTQVAVGVKNQCKSCYMRDWRNANKEHIIESRRAYVLKKK